MRADAQRADRDYAVRSAARGWKKAGAIDDATLRSIEAAYPDDRARLGLGLRILVGVATFIGGCALTGLVFMIFEPRSRAGGAALAVLLAVVFAFLTEIQTGRWRRRQAGAEFVTALLAAILAGVAVVVGTRLEAETPILATLALAHLLASWRWGYATLAALGAFFLLLFVGQADIWRVLWLASGAAGVWLILVPARSVRWPPSRRRSFEAAGATLLVGAYVAVNVYGLDHRWLELRDLASPAPSGWERLCGMAGTALLPPIVLALAVYFRDRTLLALGAIFTAASLATLRFYVSLGPVWIVLVLSGAACLGLAIAVRRWLDAGPEKERDGFTAEPLYEHRRLSEAVAAAATIAAMSPAARASEQPSFEGGGGRSGGGGATGGA